MAALASEAGESHIAKVVHLPCTMGTDWSQIPMNAMTDGQMAALVPEEDHAEDSPGGGETRRGRRAGTHRTRGEDGARHRSRSPQSSASGNRSRTESEEEEGL
jgi:hypothetical protein